MLVRDGSLAHHPGAHEQVLAACPDSPERGDEWRWSVTRVPASEEEGHWQVVVRVDNSFVAAEDKVIDEAGELALHRESGEEIVVISIDGSHLIQDASGPWRRWLWPGDVFVVEGEEPESLVLTASEHSRASVVRLTPKGDEPLRWVP